MTASREENPPSGHEQLQPARFCRRSSATPTMMPGMIGTSHSRRRFLRLAGAAAAAAVSSRSSRAQPQDAGPPAGSGAGSASATTFEAVWETVRDRFYDPHLHGLDWSAIRERYIPDAAKAASGEALADVINRMLSELHASHTRYYTPDEPEYYQLADIFAGALRRRGLESAFPGGRISYPGIGILSRTDAQGGRFVSGVIEGTPARQAGLLAGDEIISADGAPFQPVGSFRGKVGKQVVLELRRAGTVVQVTVAPTDIEPDKMFLDGLQSSVRVMQANGRRIGYVHVWSYAGYAYQRALEHLIAEGKLKDADALIWDLRDGWGGAIPEYLDIFNARAPTVEITGRNGVREFEGVKWRKPVAMLINGGTRSGKEILAYGFKKYRLGEVIGTRTEGAVLAATAFLIGGGLLLLAVDDVLIDGVRLEGVGVTPTIEVEEGPTSAETGDLQLDKAIAVLSGT
jgi:carboxyl-terminal processing protease